MLAEQKGRPRGTGKLRAAVVGWHGERLPPGICRRGRAGGEGKPGEKDGQKALQPSRVTPAQLEGQSWKHDKDFEKQKNSRGLKKTPPPWDTAWAVMTKIIPGDTSAWPHGAWRGPRGAKPSTPEMLRTTASLTPPCQTLPAPGQNIMRHNINKTFNIISLWSTPVPPARQLPPCLLCSRICRREQDLCRRQTPASWAACTASSWAAVLGCSVGLGETGRNPSVWGQHPPPAEHGGGCPCFDASSREEPAARPRGR